MSLREFVPAEFPLPWNPLIHGDLGMGDFAPGLFPLPTIPVGKQTSAANSLVAAPPIYQSQINPVTTQKAMEAAALSGYDRSLWFTGLGDTPAVLRHPYFVGLGCGDGCGCGGGCGGMGNLTSDTIIPQHSLPTFLQGDGWITGVPTVYIAGAVGVLGLMLLMGGRSRRRR